MKYARLNPELPTLVRVSRRSGEELGTIYDTFGSMEAIKTAVRLRYKGTFVVSIEQGNFYKVFPLTQGRTKKIRSHAREIE